MQTSKSAGYHYLGSLLAALGFSFFLIYLMPLFGLGDVALGKIIQNPIFLGVIAAFVVIVPIWAVIYSRRRGQLDTEEAINLFVLRYITGFLMFFYGWAKMHSKFFDITYATQDTRLADLDSFYLTWYYFGRSNVQEFIIGLMEFIPALMLFFRPTIFLGAALMLPVSLNVLMVNVFNHISGLTLPASIFVVGGNLYIVYSYKDKILSFLKTVESGYQPNSSRLFKSIAWLIRVPVLGAMALMFVFGIINVFSNPAKMIAYRNKFRGGYELSSLAINGKPASPADGDLLHYKKIYLEPQSRWNSVLTYGKDVAPKAITIQWNAQNDSVITCLKKVNDVASDEIDTTTLFKGIYKPMGDTLVIDGTQYGTKLHAVYKKLPLKDYNWFWQ